MHYTKIVTSFLKNDEKILILKRSDNVKTMKKLWSGVSGIIENNEEPLERAKIEIQEEVGMKENEIKLVKSADDMKISSPQYKNHQWHVFPFLFETDLVQVNLNWENSDFKWILPENLRDFDTVPNLERVLFSLI
tara:strand:- start:1043 stop:1447 length:405 start_codon:yes stop_codon:yes gene_type:complete